MSRHTCKKILDNSASALALSPDFTQVVIAGSHIFKIFSIDDGELNEKVNLYAAKNLNPFFSSNDVVWNPMEESKIATVANNGAVVTWDLRKSTRSKLDTVYKDHERPVNKISYHPQESHLLISGDKDGIMKIFDTRRREAVITFVSNAESVRDIQFSHHNSSFFAAGTENGNIQFWDMRKNDRTERQFTGHRGPVFALDWHPEDRSWIATASRDHTIKIWTWDLDEPYSNYTSIRTVASVGRVKWRPNKHYHLASCALAIDCSISIWDIRRPYIPFASFPEHRDVTTGIVWEGNSQSLLSVGKDNTLYCHSFEDATHPIENTNPLALDINSMGMVTSAKPIDDLTADALMGNYVQPKLATNNVQEIATFPSSDSFEPVFSVMRTFNTDVKTSPLSCSCIVEFASNYRLVGRSFNEICEHNAGVARRLNQLQIAHTWQLLQIIFGGVGNSMDSQSNKDDFRMDAVTDSELKSSRHVSGETVGDPSGGISGEEPETETDDMDNHDLRLLNIASGGTMSHDFFFGDDEISQIHFDYDNLNNCDPSYEWMLPNEAFQPRKEISYQPTTPPDDFPAGAKDDLQLSDDLRNRVEYTMADSLKILDLDFVWQTPMDYRPLVVDVLLHYASIGDVQMAVTLFIVLGDRIKNYLEESVVEHWFLSYIEILHRLSLWNTATLIIRHANGLPQIQQMNQHSTSVRIHCGSCDHSISYAKHLCPKCGNVAARCAICHCAVQGLFVWCQGCSHGGHLAHILEWIKENPSCPSGCGHFCEYS